MIRNINHSKRTENKKREKFFSSNMTHILKNMQRISNIHDFLVFNEYTHTEENP